jgi:predicted esterase
MRTAFLVIVALLLTATSAAAQVERYELGRRLKRFEAAWEEQTDPAARKRAAAIVSKASAQFLSFRLGEAARTLDEAWFALRSADPPSDAERWLAALCVIPERRLVDSSTKALRVEVRALYPVGSGPPPGAAARVRIGSGGEAVGVPLGKLPTTVVVPFPEMGRQGDLDLGLTTTLGGKPVMIQSVRVSVLRSLSDLIASFKGVQRGEAAGDLSRSRWGIEQATLIDWADLLESLAAGQVPETDIPAAVLADDTRALAYSALFDGGLYASLARRNLRLSVPTERGRVTPCRLFVPRGLENPAPVVVALHGAGGSENLFFEGYGNGHIVKECEIRNWLLVAPRGGGLLGGTPPVAEIVAKLAERYPIDSKRVFLVGHSLGAAQAVELVQQRPGLFAAVACLGGGGRVRKPEAFAELPLFVGVGSMDFARRGAKALHKSLADAGAKRASFREYPDREHLLIVREALPDVFAGFDEAAR